VRSLLLTEVFPPRVGGSGRWFWEVYRRLPREQVTVAAGEHPGATKFDCEHDLRIARLPLVMPHWGVCSPRGLGRYWRLFRALKRLVRDGDVRMIHAGRALPEGWLAWMLNRSCGLPYLVYVHGEELNIGLQSRELGWMMRRVFRRVERVIVNSRNSRRLLQDWGVPNDKVTVLNPGVDTKRFVPAPCCFETRGRFGWGERTVVLTVGRLQKRKGQDMLIRALPQIRRSIPDVLYVIMGDGEQRQALEELADETGVAAAVQFLGEGGDEDLIRCYQQCDLFALPNREVDGDIEGFGMVLLEAQACGKPVLAGDSGGTAETMRPDETGVIVDCTAPERLAAAVTTLLKDPERRQRMGTAARAWAVRRFDWNSLSLQAASIFSGERCVSTPASRETEVIGGAIR
jgi:phosphatidyl-myo-inositol dimannoside synthase